MIYKEHYTKQIVLPGQSTPSIIQISDELVKVANLLHISEADQLFRKCVNKMPINKLKHTIDETWGYVNQIGLIIPDGFVAVDVDVMEDSEIIKDIILKQGLNCIITRTKKGRHFIFRYKGKYKLPQGARLWTPIGIEVDTRVAGKGYIILPEGGERGVDPMTGQPKREYELIPNQIDEIPDWLKVDDKLKHFFKSTSLRLDEGSRDNTIFKYIKFLSDFTDLSQSSVQTITQIVNDNFFNPPMNWANEILPKIQESNWDSDRRKISKQEETVIIAKEIMEDLKIKKYQGELLSFNGYKYKPLVESDIKGIVLRQYDELMPRVRRNELVDFIEDYTVEESEQDITTSKRQIATPNQIIDLKTLATVPNDGSILNMNNIQFDYVERDWNNHPRRAFVDWYMATMFNTYEEINLIYEMIGYCMLSYSPFRKSFFLVGPAMSGKSFLIERIGVIFGTENVSAVELDVVSKDPRMAKSLKTSLINIPDDLSDIQIDNEAMFKKLISGELIEIDVKGKDSIKFQPSSTWMMTSNYKPKFRKSDDGIYSRIVLIEFTKTITPIADFDDYWTREDYEYIVYRAVHAINNALKNGGFTLPESYKRAVEDLKKDDSIVMMFMNERHAVFTDKYSTSMLYQEFSNWCVSNGFKKMNAREFKDEVCSLFNVEVKQTTNNEDLINPNNISRYVMKGTG